MNIRNLLTLICICCINTTYAQFTQVQFINNCADQSHTGFDIYINGQPSLPPEVNDLLFRESTAFLNLPAGSPVTIGIADLNSIDVNDTFLSITVTFSQADKYVIVAEGIESTTGYTPAKPFALRIYNPARDAASIGKTDILFLNGTTDAPVLDIRTGITLLADNLDYGDFSSYTELPTNQNFKLRITNPNGSEVINTFDANFPFLGVSGKAITILTSGFVDPSANSNGPAMGLWMAIPDGGPLTQLPTATELEDLARMQWIHNSADTAVGKLDLFINDELMIDTLDYRHATSYMDVFAKTPLKIGIAQIGTGVQFFDTTITLDSGKVYAAVLNGIKSDTNYKPLPDLKFDLFDGAREKASNSANVDVMMMHGSTDAPVSRVRSLTAPINEFANLKYGDYGSAYYTVTTGMEGFYIDTGSNNGFYKKYELDVSTLNIVGQSVTIIYSGFVVSDSNSKGPDFDLWMAKTEGGPLVKLPPLFISVDDVQTTTSNIPVWPNPATNTLSFPNDDGNVNLIITDITGKIVMQENEYADNNINVSSLINGNYIILLQSGDRTYYSKFTKQ